MCAAPIPAECPAPIEPGEAIFIKEMVVKFYGPDAVVRNFGPDPRHLKLHGAYRESPAAHANYGLGIRFRPNRQRVSRAAPQRS